MKAVLWITVWANSQLKEAKVESGVTGFHTLAAHWQTGEWTFLHFSSGLLNDAHETQLKWNVSTAEEMKERAAELK